MKYINKIIIVIFFVILLLPLFTFNFEEGAVSETENKVLAENPFKIDYSNTDESFHGNLDAYLNDRLGFKDELVYLYTVLNDKLFNRMEHPLYSYGKDGYVFGAGLSTDIEYSDYHEDFADMILKLQTYCEERDIPFVYAFEPAKPATIPEYIPDGTNYNRQWVDEFMEALNKRNINYVDNTKMLSDKMHSGEMVFNKQFDAGHWNALGAFYGVNAIVENLKEEVPTIHVNTMDEMDVSEATATHLPVSNFPIDEDFPVIKPKFEADYSKTDEYVNELELDEDYSTFYYYENEKRKEEGAPRALVFQGSYMNEYGYPFFSNCFSEYIYIHDYQNIINMDYYVNIFKPDCVIFEMAEYTFNDIYFSQEKMRNINFNRSLESVKREVLSEKTEYADTNDITIKEGKALTKITWNTEAVFDSVWFLMNQGYDMRKCEEGYEVTVLSEDYKNYKDDISIVTLKDSNLVEFNFN